MRPGRDGLGTILTRCGVALTPPQLDALWAYHRMLREANERLNLTRIHNFENMVLKHYVDSLLVLRFARLPSPLIDMGSGPGLPGVPLKIARPEVRVILAEPRRTRTGFLEEVREKLGLEGLEIYPHRLGPDYPGKVAGVISRAVATIPETLERVTACLEPGGKMLFMKGPGCDPEVEEAARDASLPFRLAADHAYEIPGTTHHRRLVVYERLDADPPAARARRPGPARAATSAPEAGAPHAGPVREIASPSNPSYRQFRDLLGGPGIRKHGQALLAGRRILDEVIARFPEGVRGWLTDPSGPPPPREGWTWYRLEISLFRSLDVAGTGGPLLLVEVPPMEPWSADAPWPDGCTLFVPFQDPENVGAVIRSAAAFGVARVVLLREAAHPFHPRAGRAAGPAILQVPLLLGPSIRDLDPGRHPLIALDTDGPELGSAPFPGRFGLVVGLEGPGLPEALRRGERRRIAIRPGVESLNAATAAAIALHAWASGRGGPPAADGPVNA